jgi:hypothetical protein
MGYQFTLEDKIKIVKFLRLHGIDKTIQAVGLRTDELGKSRTIAKSTLYDGSFAPKSKRPKRIRQLFNRS